MFISQSHKYFTENFVSVKMDTGWMEDTAGYFFYSFVSLFVGGITLLPVCLSELLPFDKQYRSGDWGHNHDSLI